MLPGLLVPLILPAVSYPVGRWLAPRLAPGTASRLLAFLAVVFAAGSTAALALGAAAGLARVPFVAELGGFAGAATGAAGSVPTAVSIGCGVLLLAAVGSVVAAIRDQWRWYRRVHLELDEYSRANGVVILPEAEPVAFAIAGRGGRIAVSRGMLAALAGDERAALLFHERAHLRLRHPVYAAAGVLAAALNPLVRPLTKTARFTMERWADETAATATGDRRVVATAVAKAALAGRQHAYALSAAGGPVPQRVRALLDAPPKARARGRGLLTAFAVAVVLGGCGAAAGVGAEAVVALHAGIETAQRASCSAHPVLTRRHAHLVECARD